MFAEHVFRLAQPEQDGATLRQHLEVMEQATGQTPAELQEPPFPAPLETLWLGFLDLAGRRQVGGSGAGPLTYPDFDAWARLTGRRVTPRDIRILCRLDDCWLASQRSA